MTSEVAGLTESKFSATQAGPCSHTDVPIVLTVTLCVVWVVPRFAALRPSWPCVPLGLSGQ